MMDPSWREEVPEAHEESGGDGGGWGGKGDEEVVGRANEQGS
jgi:hypothetical protein